MKEFSSSDLVLIHLRGYWNARGELPREITQDGIAQATRMRRTHVPRTLKKMRQTGLVEEQFGHVRAVKRRIKTYFLTEKGLRRADAVISELTGAKVTLCRASGESQMSLGEACAILGLKTLEALNLLTPNDMLIVPETGTEEFLDREGELEELGRSFRGRAKVVALYGSTGVGKTALIRKFLQDLPADWRPVWYDLSERGQGEFFGYFSRYLGLEVVIETPRLADNLCAALQRTNTLLVFDGYFNASEELVDFFSYLVKRLERTEGLKALFTVNEATPSYCRFYGRDALENGSVQELHLKGLDERSARALLGAEGIDGANFRHIYLMTRGNPLYLKLIRDERLEELRERSRFSMPEIKLLVHYKNAGAEKKD